MSQFDRYTTTEYVEGLRVFLNMKKQGFQREAGLVESPDQKRKGRLPKYPEEALKALEAAVNAKASRCEAKDSTLGERLRLARDYCGFSDSHIARQLGVSRELVRRWGENLHRPSCMPQLAEVLGVPEAWLAEGGEQYLPADSYIGVRVGDEAMELREQLYSQELQVVAELPDDADVMYAQAYIEHAIKTRPELAMLARRSGGRWQSVGASLLFAPWIPIPEHGLSRRYWSDTVEALIEETLAEHPSVYGAWGALKQRCEAMGLTPEDYPRRISLHKRVEKERERAQKYGVDLNAMIAESEALHPQVH